MPNSFSLSVNGSTLICGHRGNSLRAPENTIPAIESVVAAGGNAAEIDINLTKDHQIAVLHDLSVDRTTNGSGDVGKLTLAEIQALDAGGWFDERFRGTHIPSLSEAVAAARRLDIVFDVEVKEKGRPDDMIPVLERVLSDPEDRKRVMLISFDHLWLRQAKLALPWLQTGGIAHERYADPVAVAESALLDQLCIDYGVFDIEQAKALHNAGKTIRCHAYAPAVINEADRGGLGWRAGLIAAIREGVIDTVSGDDVTWLVELVGEAEAEHE